MKDQHKTKAQLIDELEQTRGRVAEFEQVEEALRESEERYSSLVESTHDAVYQIGLDMRFQFANRKYLSRVGLSLTELVGQEYGKLHPWDTSEEFIEIVDKVIKSGKPVTYEYFSYRDNKYFLRTLSPVIGKKSGEISAINIFSKDITKCKQVEEALRESEVGYRDLVHELETILDLIPGIIAYKDKNNNLIRVNKYLADAHNMTKEEMRGKNCFDLYPKEQAQKYWDDDLEVINSRKPLLNIEESWQSDEGMKWVNTNKVPYIGENGEVIGVLGTAMDITELKQMENALRESEKTLAIKNDSLNDKNAALRELIRHIDDEKNEMVNRILANVDQLIMPILARVRRMENRVDMQYIDLLEESLNNIISNFGYELYKKSPALSPREVEIGNMIK
ncbi:PAS domain-containing protein, partial [Candidatus Neomarinimicrobiota bacterium]